MNRTTKQSIIIAAILLFATAHAATTTINSHTLTTTHGFFEGRVSIGTLTNLTSYQLFVQNNTLISGDLNANGTVMAGTNTTIGRVGPSTEAGITMGSATCYNSAADTFRCADAIQSAFDISSRQGTSTAVLIGNVGPSSQSAVSFQNGECRLWRNAASLLETNCALDVDGTFIASTNTYLNGTVGMSTLVDAGFIMHLLQSAASDTIKIEQVNTAGGDPIIQQYKAGGTQASKTSSGVDVIGGLYGFGYDGNSYERGGGFRVQVDGSIADEQLPTRVDFFGRTSAGTDQVLRFTARADGTVAPGADGTQDLGSTSAHWNKGYFDNYLIAKGLPGAGTGLVLQSPDGNYWRASLSNVGVLTWVSLGTTEP